MSPLDAFPAQRLGNMSEEEFWAFARKQASGDAVSPSSENARAGHYLECVLRQRSCLLPLAAIEEVIPSPARYALLPAMPRWMPGLAAWRGEVMAVVNLEAYLSGIDLPSTGGLLLCMSHANLALGLFLPAIGPTIAPGKEQGTDVLDIDTLLTDVVRQIGMAAHNG